MKLVIIVSLAVFAVSIGGVMFATGTFKPHKAASTDGEPANSTAAEENGAVDKPGGPNQAKSPDKTAEESPAQMDSGAQAVPQKIATEDSATDEVKLQAKLAEYKRKITESEKQLAALEAEIAALRDKKTSLEAFKQLSKIYSSMSPENAALILTELILSQMNDRAVGKIMDAIAEKKPEYAAGISKLIAASPKS